MEKRNKIFYVSLCCIALIGIGAGGMYLINKDKFDFIDRYPIFFEAEKFATETLEIGVPEGADNSGAAAYFDLYNDPYTKWEKAKNSNDIKYVTEIANDLPVMTGSGLCVGFNSDNQPCITYVYEGSEAERQGLKAGDIFLNIDDKDIDEPKYIQRINGEDGTTAKLVLLRDGEEIRIDFVRKADSRKNIGVECKKYGDALYLRIPSMTGETADLTKKLLRENDFGSVIFDVRGNPGGQMQYAVSIADDFLGEGYVTINQANGADEVMKVDQFVLYDVPAVILMDSGTASAAEGFTALMKQFGNATLVGVKTYGKGVHQSEAMFMGGILKYTEGEYTVGTWECYQGVGIKPDIEIFLPEELKNTEKDIQLKKALELLGENVQNVE